LILGVRSYIIKSKLVIIPVKDEAQQSINEYHWKAVVNKIITQVTDYKPIKRITNANLTEGIINKSGKNNPTIRIRQSL
jgi:hypothetical protein